MGMVVTASMVVGVLLTKTLKDVTVTGTTTGGLEKEEGKVEVGELLELTRLLVVDGEFVQSELRQRAYFTFLVGVKKGGPFQYTIRASSSPGSPLPKLARAILLALEE